VHDLDREKASSIIANISIPSQKKQLQELKQNPYFADDKMQEQSLDFKVKDLIKL
jgi:hypothetical protein